MEVLAEQPTYYQHETFDRYLRTYNDTATWLAETLDGSMRTPFEFSFDGHDVIAEDGGSMRTVFERSLIEAQSLAAKNPKLSFELRRRQLEMDEYDDIVDMARGNGTNVLVVVSDFPPELTHATQDVGGYNVTRKQTMLRVVTWDGRQIKMYSQTLDGSNRAALESIYHHFEQQPQPGELLGQRIKLKLPAEDVPYLTDHVMRVYDRSLEQQLGGSWHAGRREAARDTYQFVLSQHDLLDHFAKRFMRRRPSSEDYYNIAALMRKRFNGFETTTGFTASEAAIALGGIIARDLDWQLQQAGKDARAEGYTASGCGITVGSQGSAEDQLGAAGYGNKSGDDEDKFGSLTFTCPKGHTNRRSHGKLLSNCQKCGMDVSCKAPEKPKSPVTLPQKLPRGLFELAA